MATTRIADDYPSIKKAMEKLEKDRNVSRFVPPDGITIVLHKPDVWNPQDGLCYILNIDVGRLNLLLLRNWEPDIHTTENFFQVLQQYFPSARLRTATEIGLSLADTQLLASRLAR